MRFLVYGLNYAPELVGVGKYTTECAEWLAREHQVTVITAPPHFPQWRIPPGYTAGERSAERCNGVQVYRSPLWLPLRMSAPKRILCCLFWMLRSLPWLLAEARRRPDALLVIQPTIFALPAAWLAGALFGVPLWVHVQDFELNAASGLGMVRGSWLTQFGGALEGWLLRRARRVSTLTERMRLQLDAYRVLPARQALFPNWVDCKQIYPLAEPSPLRQELGLGAGDIVLMFSGSFGKKHGLEILVEAARALQDRPGLRMVLCGEGAERETLRQSAAGLDNIMWLPLQPIERLNQLLNLADIHLIAQRPDVADAVFPSKLTGCFASGRPVVATAAPGTELARMVAAAGVVVVPGDVAGLVRAILELAGDAPRRLALGARARLYAEAHLDRERVLGAFEAALCTAAVEGGHRPPY